MTETQVNGMERMELMDQNGRRQKSSVIAFTGGQILTMNPQRENAEAVVVKNGRIADVGGKEILWSYPDARVIDLQGRTLLPAFIDSHNHLSFACFIPRWIDLAGITTKEGVLEAISKFKADAPNGEWIVGFPWTDVEDGGAALSKKDLDEMCSDRPVVLIHGTIHKLMLNSKGLEMAGIGPSTPEPSFGKIVRDADGETTGALLEIAEVRILKMVLQASTPEYADLIEARAKELLSYGITAVQDPGVTPEAQKAYWMLHAQGRLPISILMMPHGEAILDNGLANCLEGPVTGSGDEWLRIGPVKLFADGGITGQIANAGKINGNDYAACAPRSDFAEPLIEATRRGFQVCVHSIGNVTTDAVLDTFEKAAKVAPEGFEMRPRIEHMFILNDKQIERLASLRGCASIQPFFFARIRKRRIPCFDGYKWFPFRDLVESGATVAANSDDPGFGSMAYTDPIKGSLLGVSMGDKESPFYCPEQAMPFERWLWMYTAAAAYVGGLEDERGMLKKGLVADLVVLGGKMDATDPPVVEETWKAGKLVFSRSKAILR